ncbi:MAG: prolyl-tRNA synthetase associated domain-containing protein [Muribaculaceae bacterium]|nr:prolyl-tRNA synthetase associated domain-containing protein [Muribaculaceae bacterium]
MKIYKGRPQDSSHIIQPEEDAVYDFLEKLGIEFQTLIHPAAFTMEECEKVRREIGIPFFKNLFLTNKQQTQFYLLITPHDKQFKTKYLSSQIGCSRLSFASPKHMKDLLNILPGAVSPMGLIHDKQKRIKFLIDKDLSKVDVYACHPCVNTASIILSFSDLISKVIPATDHMVTWVELPSGE